MIYGITPNTSPNTNLCYSTFNITDTYKTKRKQVYVNKFLEVLLEKTK